MELKKVKQLAELYAGTVDSAAYVGGFHNEVYRIKGDIEFFLRISSVWHRSSQEIAAELDFLLYLCQNGAPVACPVMGVDGKYAYEWGDGESLKVICAFSIAQGLDWCHRGVDEGDRLIHIGKAMGRIHRLSQAYRPPDHLHRRQWHESQHLIEALDLFNCYDGRLAERFGAYMDKMKQLPRNNGDFGLIHGDFLFSNYNIAENKVTVFDFDECEYSWFMYDIAVCMYYYLLGGNPDELSGKGKEAEELLYCLLYGYLQENQMDSYWIQNIGLFFQMREFVLLSTILKNSPSGVEGWQKAFLNGALDRQLHGKPFIEADFGQSFARLL